jgi:endonuclease-8
MPEGDTIFRLAARLSRAIGGKEVRAFRAHTIDDAAARTVVGRAVAAVEARGKNLLVRFDDGRALHVHLRMLGRVRIEPARLAASRAAYRAAAGRARARGGSAGPQLVLEVDGVVVTGRRLPVLRLLAPGAERRAPELSRLGPDLLSDAFDEREAVARLRAAGARGLAIAEALLVQRALAGIGNVYKSEALFLERLDPRTPVARLDDAALLSVVRRARALLRANAGGSAPRRTRASLAGPRLWVYGRAGAPCLACGAPIERLRERPGVRSAPRSTYRCPSCQRGPRAQP